MGMLGLHLRLTDQELADVQAHQGYSSMFEYVSNVLEEPKFETGDVAESDRSWAYIHSALLGIDPDGPLQREPTDAELADPSDSRYLIMGREVLESSDDAYVGLTRVRDAESVATAISALSVDELANRVRRAHQRFHATGDADEVVEYATSWFRELVAFYRVSAERGANIVFTVSF